MSYELLVTGVTRQAGGRSYIGYGPLGGRRWGFVRLVAPTPDGVLFPQHYHMQDMTEPRLWDVIRVEAPWADSRPMQPENRVVDHTPWHLLERPASLEWMRQLEAIPVERGPLLGTPGRAIRAHESGVAASIAYVEPEGVEAVCEWDSQRERYRARMRFSVAAHRYDLPLSDLHCSQILCHRPEGIYSPGQVGCRAPHGLRMLVTLGEPFHGWCYKLVTGLLARRTVKLMRDDTSSTLSTAVRHVAGDPLEHPGAFACGA